MRNRAATLCPIAAVVATLIAAGAPARADVPPPDSCTAPGPPCQNAGPQYDQSGTCVATMCTRQVPTADGGTMAMTYDCNRCQRPDGGAGGGGGTGAGGSTSHPSSGSSWCAVAPRAAENDCVAPAVLLLAGLALAAARRRTSVE